MTRYKKKVFKVRSQNLGCGRNVYSWDEFVGYYNPKPYSPTLQFLNDLKVHPVLDLIEEFVGHDSPYIYGDYDEMDDEEQNWYVDNYEYGDDRQKQMDDEYLQYQFYEEDEDDFDESDYGW